MRVINFFDGLAGGLVSLKKTGVPVDEYHAFEIDKYAMKIAKKNHPEIIHRGDIKNFQLAAQRKCNLFLAGPPCQGFSCAGNRLNFDDHRSKLFLDTIEIMKEINPDNFLIENVASMKKEIRWELDELIGVKSVMINSNLVSAQNRKRLYWVSPGLNLSGLIKDRGIFLKDIIETDVDNKYYLHKGRISGKCTLNRLVDSLRFPDEKSKSMLTEQGFTKIGNTCLVQTFPAGERSIKNMVDGLRFKNEKSRNLTTEGARKISGASSTCLIIQTPRGNNPGGIRALDGKTPALSSSSWVDNNHLLEMVLRNGSKETFLKVSRKLKISPDQLKSNCLTATAKNAGNHSDTDWLLFNDYSFRRLTPTECEALQNLTRNYTESVSNTQRYKMIANGWTIDIIVEFLKQLRC